MITIIHAERYELFRKGLKWILKPYENECCIITEVDTFDKLFSELNIHAPDILIISHMLRDGLLCEYVEFIHEKYPAMRIIVLTMAFCEEVMLSLIEHVHAFIGKHVSGAEIIYTIWKVQGGESHFTLPGWSIAKK